MRARRKEPCLLPSGYKAVLTQRPNSFAAVHESVCGTKRTWRDVRLESVMSRKADIGQGH